MRRYERPSESLLVDMDGPVLVSIGNWLAESLDASELEEEQVLLLHMVLGRCLDVLWRLFPEVLLPLIARVMQREEDEDYEDDYEDDDYDW